MKINKIQEIEKKIKELDADRKIKNLSQAEKFIRSAQEEGYEDLSLNKKKGKTNEQN